MKKLLSILLAVMMIVAMFAGCSEEPEEVITDNENPGENSGIVVESLNKTITAVVYDRGEDEPYDETFWNGIKENFEKANQGVTVNLIFTKDAGYEVRERILSGNSPDFVFLPSYEESGVTEALVKDKAFYPLTALEESMYAPKGAMENNICKPYEDGVTYIAPAMRKDIGLIYNTEFLSENGFSVPKTWDDFISIAEACKNKNFSFFTYAGAEPDEFVDIFAAALVPVIGAAEMDKLLDCDEEAWKNENIKTFVEKIEKITKLVASGSSTKTKEDTLELLEDKKVLFVYGNSDDLEELNKDENKYSMTAFPSLSGENVNIISFSEMYIPVEAKEPELAIKFMEQIYFDASAASDLNNNFFAADFEEKAADNATLSDEFCKLIVDVFKGNVTSEKFGEKMLEYIEEY
ncbi:MAG: extracellular solute-binding protein [Oscillospiraceae bacterium]|nr:extracellular solute-binding protein [Oscillospiraceae bacterium]